MLYSHARKADIPWTMILALLVMIGAATSTLGDQSNSAPETGDLPSVRGESIESESLTPSSATDLRSLVEELRQRIDRLEEEKVALSKSSDDETDSISDRATANFGDDDQSQPSDIRTDEAFHNNKNSRLDDFFNEGFKWETKDGKFTLNFHNETQLDVRTYAQPNSDPTNQFGFYIPRVRFIFNGRLTKPIEYNVSINKGLGNLDLLDAYLNFNYDKRFQFRFGRYRVPFMYDWYALSNQFLPTPERSVFAINYGYNRNTAVMLHGELFIDQVDYAVAATNGPRNSYFDENASKDVLGFFNVRPFLHCDCLDALHHLNVGGSMTYGFQDQEPLPFSFYTSANASESVGSLRANSTFLRLNSNVIEYGTRSLWEVHLAYYFKSLTLMGSYDSGFNNYGFNDQFGKVHLPTSGYHAQFAYFLTGEEIERREFVEVKRPFDPLDGDFGLGAWEIQCRFDHFQVGDQVFSDGLADPSYWTNEVNTIDAGLNWYLNKYTKVYFDWQHAMYQNPVLYKPGGWHRTNDLFWVRFQIYF